MRNLIIILMTFVIGLSLAQEETTMITGTVINQKTQLPMHGVTVINLNKVKGTTTNAMGSFQLEAQTNDTLHLSYIGFDPLKVRVTREWILSKVTTIELIEKSILIDEVEITGIKLTGYLDVDHRLITRKEDYRFSISGLVHGYEAGKRSTSAFSKAMNSIFNPADLLYNTFGKKPRELAKLREMKKDKTVKELLEAKFDRETLSALLGLSKKEIDDILSNCNYSQTFISNANDLQVLDAINECYEEYKLMNRK